MGRDNQDQRGKYKIRRLSKATKKPIPKPAWIKVKIPASSSASQQKSLFRQYQLKTVCEEAACPNLGECFSNGTATFMIMGGVCTRRCPFCDVAHGRPLPLDEQEPAHLAAVIKKMGLRYVVITSVDRDDLKDGGAAHFVRCIQAVRANIAAIQVEVLVPDFRHKIDQALAALRQAPPDVFNHNMETVPRLYQQVRPVANYQASLELLYRFKQQHAGIPTKSGLMLGLGEQIDEVKQVLQDLRRHDCDMLTLGQYLQPSRYHLPVSRFVPPREFQLLGEYASTLGFTHVASAPMVRSSYHADVQRDEARLNEVTQLGC